MPAQTTAAVGAHHGGPPALQWPAAARQAAAAGARGPPQGMPWACLVTLTMPSAGARSLLSWRLRRGQPFMRVTHSCEKGSFCVSFACMHALRAARPRLPVSARADARKGDID